MENLLFIPKSQQYHDNKPKIGKNWVSRHILVENDRKLITCDHEYNLVIAKASNSKPIQRMVGHTDYINEIKALSDGSLISASRDDTLRVWNTFSGVCFLVLNGHEGAVFGIVEIAPLLIITGGSDKTLRLWDLSNKKLNVCTRTYPLKAKCFDLVALPEGKFAATSGCEVNVYDPPSSSLETQPAKTIEASGSIILSLFPLHEEFLLTAGYESSIRLWNWTSNVLVRVFEDAHSLCKILVVANNNLFSLGLHSIRAWNIHTGELLETTARSGNQYKGIVMKNDGSCLIVSKDAKINTWEISKVQNLITTGHC
jgi:WD40 repeat protein